MKKEDTNELLTIYNQLNEFKIVARKRIMEKCSWGRDTFFKKMATPEKMSEAEYCACKIVLDVTLDQCTSAATLIQKS